MYQYWMCDSGSSGGEHEDFGHTLLGVEFEYQYGAVEKFPAKQHD